jgi:hypothetical protein
VPMARHQGERWVSDDRCAARQFVGVSGSHAVGSPR